MKKYIQKSLMLSAIILLIVTLVSFLCFEYKDEMKFNFLLVCRKESSFLYYQNLPRERRIISCPKEARKDYFHRCFSFRRMGWKWPLFTFCIFSALTALSLFIGVVFLGYEMPAMDFLHAILKNPLMLFPVLLISLISGPLNEEFGWSYSTYVLKPARKPASRTLFHRSQHAHPCYEHALFHLHSNLYLRFKEI